ncbi:unnamed protein product [Prorocentrum cordatum]|uniref:Uncharacterized protein n=1 Tax=Prorocentrum cordatum TaxID=2364126 RepID=A0ABN9QVZ0_9DINO|nr:unnamed protein product [Polarella glacialis]
MCRPRKPPPEKRTTRVPAMQAKSLKTSQGPGPFHLHVISAPGHLDVIEFGRFLDMFFRDKSDVVSRGCSCQRMLPATHVVAVAVFILGRSSRWLCTTSATSSHVADRANAYCHPYKWKSRLPTQEIKKGA